MTINHNLCFLNIFMYKNTILFIIIGLNYLFCNYQEILLITIML